MIKSILLSIFITGTNIAAEDISTRVGWSELDNVNLLTYKPQAEFKELLEKAIQSPEELVQLKNLDYETLASWARRGKDSMDNLLYLKEKLRKIQEDEVGIIDFSNVNDVIKLIDKTSYCFFADMVNKAKKIPAKREQLKKLDLQSVWSVFNNPDLLTTAQGQIREQDQQNVNLSDEDIKLSDFDKESQSSDTEELGYEELDYADLLSWRCRGHSNIDSLNYLKELQEEIFKQDLDK